MLSDPKHEDRLDRLMEQLRLAFPITPHHIGLPGMRPGAGRDFNAME